MEIRFSQSDLCPALSGDKKTRAIVRIGISHGFYRLQTVGGGGDPRDERLVDDER